MTEVELAWMAGIVEGEGCFCLRRGDRRYSPEYRMPILRVGMTDEDVVRRLQDLWPAKMYGPYQYGSRKPFWTWEVWGQRLTNLLPLLYPLMGKRRQGKIDEMKEYLKCA